MQRHTIQPRPDWPAKVEETGLTYHTHDEGPYWDESAFYEFSSREVDELEAAANSLHELCIQAAEAVITRGWFPRLGIPQRAVPAILESWERDDFSLYGRFDVVYDGRQPPKLLEYNADTPTSLVEAAVTQWYWLEELFPGCDQFNSLHERLVAAWKSVSAGCLHLCSVKDHLEDEQTVLYLQDTCFQAGFNTKLLAIEDIGWNSARGRFTDLEDREIEACFKLYPWEWMWEDEFAGHLPGSPTQFIEPAWKMLLSNKGILPILWELFPGHPNLLPAYETADPLGADFVRKPKLGREGANTTIRLGGQVREESDGAYGAEGFVYQAVAPLPDFAGNHPILGLWIVNHEAAGLGIREDRKRIIGNTSRFIPHRFS